MAFADVFQQGTGYASRDFERMLGRFYGLLPTAINSSLYKGEKDVDYCEDTYSFFKMMEVLKRSLFLYIRMVQATSLTHITSWMNTQQILL